MDQDLMQRVVARLQERKGQWTRIAEDLAPQVSYSLIAQLGRGKYKSETSYRKLKLLAEYLGEQAQ